KMKKLYLYKDENDDHIPQVSEEFYKYVEKHQNFLEKIIDYERDFLIDYFGFKTFERIYCSKIDGKCIDRPQDLYMRVSVALWMNHHSDEEDIANIKYCYDMLSCKFFTAASPTLFNAGSSYNQFASCFLLGTTDSIKGISKSNYDMSLISKEAGGIGIHTHS